MKRGDDQTKKMIQNIKMCRRGKLLKSEVTFRRVVF